MIFKFFSQPYLKKLQTLAKSHEKSFLLQKLFEAVEAQKPLKAMELALASTLQDRTYFSQLVEAPSLSLEDLREALKLLSDSPLRTKYALLLSTIDPTSRAFVDHLEPQNFSLGLKICYVLLRQRKIWAVEIVRNLEERVLPLEQKVQWLKNVYFLLGIKTDFPFSTEWVERLGTFFSHSPPKKMYGVISHLLVHLLEWIGGLGTKYPHRSIDYDIGEWLVMALPYWNDMLEKCFRKYFQTWFEKRNLGRWFEALVEQKEEKFLKSAVKQLQIQVGTSPSPGMLLLPLLQKYGAQKALTKFAEDLYSFTRFLDERIRLRLLAEKITPRKAQLLLEEIRREPDNLRKILALGHLLNHPPTKGLAWKEGIRIARALPTTWKKQLLHLLVYYLPEEEKGTAFLLRELDSLPPMEKLEVYFGLAERCFYLSQPYEKVLKKIKKILFQVTGSQHIYGTVLMGIWENLVSSSSFSKEIFERIHKIPVFSKQLPSMEKALEYSINSPLLSPIAFSTIERYLQNIVQDQNICYSKLTSCLASKTLVARGWKEAKEIFKLAFFLRDPEDLDYSLESQLSVIWDLAAIAESTATSAVWSYALNLTSKIEDGYTRYKALHRLMHLPSYAITTNGSRYCRLLREMFNLPENIHRYWAFLATLDVLEQHKHLIYDKSNILSLLRRLSRQLEEPDLIIAALCKSALFASNWEKPTEASHLFSSAWERLIRLPNQHKKLLAIENFVLALSQLEDIEPGKKYIHDLSILASEMGQYHVEIYALLGLLLATWNSPERAKKSLEKAFQLLKTYSSPMPFLQGLDYLCRSLRSTKNTTGLEEKILPSLHPLIFQNLSANNLWLSQGIGHLSMAYFSMENLPTAKKYLREAFSFLTFQPHLKKEMLLDIMRRLTHGLVILYGEEEVFEILLGEIKNVYYFPYQEELYPVFTELALRNSMPEMVHRLLQFVENPRARDCIFYLYSLYNQYCDLEEALDCAEKITTASILSHLVHQLCRNSALFKTPRLTKRLFQLAIGDKNCMDSVLAAYLKEVGQASLLAKTLESIEG